MNTYVYVGGNPLKSFDFYGLADKCKVVLRTGLGFNIEMCTKEDDKKKKNKQKREKKQIKDICDEYDIKDRNDFGDFLEEWKGDNGYTGNDSLPYETLRDAAKEYLGH